MKRRNRRRPPTRLERIPSTKAYPFFIETLRKASKQDPPMGNVAFCHTAHVYPLLTLATLGEGRFSNGSLVMNGLEMEASMHRIFAEDGSRIPSRENCNLFRMIVDRKIEDRVPLFCGPAFTYAAENLRLVQVPEHSSLSELGNRHHKWTCCNGRCVQEGYLSGTSKHTEQFLYPFDGSLSSVHKVRNAGRSLELCLMQQYNHFWHRSQVIRGYRGKLEAVSLPLKSGGALVSLHHTRMDVADIPIATLTDCASHLSWGPAHVTLPRAPYEHWDHWDATDTIPEYSLIGQLRHYGSMQLREDGVDACGHTWDWFWDSTKLLKSKPLGEQREDITYLNGGASRYLLLHNAEGECLAASYMPGLCSKARSSAKK